MIHRTVTLDAAPDLNHVCAGDGVLFVRDGVGVAGRGIAAECAADEAPALFAAIEGDDQPLGGPVMLGLVPFLPGGASHFVLPRFTVMKHPDGSATATLVGQSAAEVDDAAFDRALEEVLRTGPPRPSSNSFRVAALTPVESYLAAVAAVRDEVRSGRISKAVIARDIEIAADAPIDVHAVLLRLRASFGSSYRYMVGDMIGASPELLVSVAGRTVRSHPLAGTAPRTGDPSTDARLAAELVASTKDQIEHRVVIDMVRDTLLPHCSYLDWEAEPSIVTVANVQHLGTEIEGALSEPAPHVLELVRALCPTPALGGHPSAEAIDLIGRVEHSERGWYGGAVGWIDAHGQGTFAVTIRCAELSADRRRARLFAGGGIVAASDPHAELAETQAKFQAMLSAIVRP
jgi:menaquinone-specific isochorismate synthase